MIKNKRKRVFDIILPDGVCMYGDYLEKDGGNFYESKNCDFIFYPTGAFLWEVYDEEEHDWRFCETLEEAIEISMKEPP